MNTEECIKWLKDAAEVAELKEWRVDEIIKRLQIWEDLKSEYGTFYRDTEEGRCLGEMMAQMEYTNSISSEKLGGTVEEEKLEDLKHEINFCKKEIQRFDNIITSLKSIYRDF